MTFSASASCLGINPLSIAFIPRTNNSTIDGFNFTQEYSLKKISKEKFYLEDTIKVKNDFGIALKVSDKVNLQPFSYGIYSIDLFVDVEYHYGIEFKKTNNNSLFKPASFGKTEVVCF